MSTSQITNSSGQIQYEDEYIELPMYIEICERCLERTHEDSCVYFFSKKLKRNYKQTISAVVCRDCWKRFYEYYEDEYLIVDEKNQKQRKALRKNNYPKYEPGEIASINSKKYKGQGKVIKNNKQYCIIRNIKGVKLKIHKNNLTKI